MTDGVLAFLWPSADRRAVVVARPEAGVDDAEDPASGVAGVGVPAGVAVAGVLGLSRGGTGSELLEGVAAVLEAAVVAAAAAAGSPPAAPAAACPSASSAVGVTTAVSDNPETCRANAEAMPGCPRPGVFLPLAFCLASITSSFACMFTKCVTTFEDIQLRAPLVGCRTWGHAGH